MLRKLVADPVLRGKRRKDLKEAERGLVRKNLTQTLWLVITSLLVPILSIAAPYQFSFRSVLPSPIMDVIPAMQLSAEHSAVLAAGFGFQAAGSSMITIRTYDAPTGAILSEDSFDVNIKEEGAAEHDGNKGRIFAGGIGTDSKGKSAFILRVYDAETGRFLWEGQLNMLKGGEGGMTKTSAMIIPRNPSMVQTSGSSPRGLQTLFSVRAVNPVTGGLIWQDQFAPGIRKRTAVEGVLFDVPTVRSVGDPIGHVFDLIVRTYDRASGTLLWEDSFEELDRIEDQPNESGDHDAHPQAIPLWNTNGAERGSIYRTLSR
jgi:hypothetical protein